MLLKGPRVMVWAAFHRTTKSESERGGVTAQQYLDCLEEFLLPLMASGSNMIFMHDGASIHQANIVKEKRRDTT